jgi:hypothetical protein
MMFNKKGQGTIEYLIIIAIVIVIALVVVGLLLQVMGQGGEIPEQTARIAWQSATPIAITDWAQTGTTLTLIMKNQAGQTVELNTVTVDGNTVSVDTTMAPGAIKNVAINTTSSVGTGNRYVYPKDTIDINYDMGEISNRKMPPIADIVGTAN